MTPDGDLWFCATDHPRIERMWDDNHEPMRRADKLPRQALTNTIEEFRQIAKTYREDAENGGPNLEGKRISELLAKAYEHVVRKLEPLVEKTDD